MMKRSLILLVMTGLPAFAHAGWDASVQCHGLGVSEDGMDYEAWFNGTVEGGLATLDVEVDGHNDKSEYDIENRFNPLQVAGALARDAQGRLLGFDVHGPVLPQGRGLELSIPLDRARTQTRFTLERQSGGRVFGTLSCGVQLPQSCHTETHCHRSCHPMVGCDQFCEPVTACTPGQFADGSSPQG